MRQARVFGVVAALIMISCAKSPNTIDLINEIGKRLGNLEVQVQTAVFDTIFTALASGRFDVVISAVTIKADRKKTVDVRPTKGEDQCPEAA